MKKTKPIKYPSRKITKEERENSPEIDKTIYKSIIGELLFISTKTRPDIAFAVNQARHSEYPKEVDLKSAHMILQYLNSTKEKSIHYKGDKNISVYCDADFAEDEETRKSTTGYIFLNGDSPISWKSQLQKCVTLSTAEAEFVSLTECTKHGMWLQKLLGEIFNNNFTLKINIDNKSCKFIAENENSNARCKHMDIKYKYVSEKINEGKVSLKYVDTENMVADSLTI